MIYTTLSHIREHNPCPVGWRKLLKYLGKTETDDAPLAYSTILESNGLDDALWCLRAEPQHARIWRMFAVRCARRVQHLMTDERSIQCLDVAERHARGLATAEELCEAQLDAGAAVWDATGADTRAALVAARAAEAAAWAAALGAAGAAVWAATWDTTLAAARAEQTDDFRTLLAAHHAMPGESCALVDWW